MTDTALSPADAPSWTQFVTNFDQAYSDFYTNYNGLMAQGPYIQSTHPELLDYYNSLLQQGSDAAYKLEQLKATRDYVSSWLTYLQNGVDSAMATAQAAYDNAKSALGLSGLGDLGIAPVIVVVGLAAATVTLVEVSNLIGQYYAAAQRFNQLQALEATGVSPAQAAAQVNAVSGPPPTNDFLGIPWSTLAFVALAIFLGPPLIDAFERNRR
jgi:hypothetical protein